MYYSDTRSLLDEHLEVHASMEAGELSVQMSSVKPFGRIPVDQSREDNKQRHSDSWRNEGIQLKARCTAGLLNDR